MKDKVKYIDNAGGFFLAYIGFCPSEKAWDKEMKRLKVKDTPYPETAAHCLYLNKKEDHLGHCIIVTIKEEFDDKPEQIVSLLVHECVHVTQFLHEIMGEDKPSAEFQAYTTQYVFQNLLDAYTETRGNPLKSPEVSDNSSQSESIQSKG